MSNVAERFEEKYIPEPNSGCWLWMGTVSKKGYGAFRIDGRVQGAHRASWMLRHRSLVDEGMSVLHNCDTPCCVNPDHLFLGTNQDNVDDKVSKGRQHRPKGTLHGEAKLTEGDIPKIFSLWRGGLYQGQIAKMFGVSRAKINQILNGKAWTHVNVQ